MNSFVEMNIVIKVDPQFGRANFPDKTNQLEFNTTVRSVEQCKEYDAAIKFSIADIFKPIDIEMHHSVLDKVPDSGGKCIFIFSNIIVDKIHWIVRELCPTFV